MIYKHTSYLSSKYKLLFTLPSSKVTPTSLFFLVSGVAYYLAFRALKFSWVLISLGLIISIIELVLYKDFWGSRLRYSTIRRITSSLLFSSAVWTLSLVVMLNLGPYGDAVIYSAFVLWVARGYVSGSIFTDAKPSAIFAALSSSPVPVYNLVVCISQCGFVLPSLALGTVLLFMGFVGLHVLDTSGPFGAGGLEVLRAFLEAWMGGDGRRLEGLLSKLGSPGVLRAAVIGDSSANFRMVVPYAHPGPMRPIGSYDLPSMLMRSMNERGLCGVALHTLLDHEHDLVLRKDAVLLVDRLMEKLDMDCDEAHSLTGPMRVEGDRLKLTGYWIGRHTVLLFSEAKDGLEDFNNIVLQRIEGLGKEYGVDVIAIDAHNSLGPDPTDEEIAELLTLARGILSKGPPSNIVVRCGCYGAQGRGDPEIGPGGIVVVVLEDNMGAKHALVVVDANNANRGLREDIYAGLGELGIMHSILCTTDTHVNSGSILSPRGYLTLGERTSFDVLVDGVVRATEMAIKNLSRCRGFCVDRFRTRALFLGSGFLDKSTHLLRLTLRRAKLLSAILFMMALLFGAVLVL